MLAVLLAVVVMIFSAWVATESVLNVLGMRALLVAPRDAAKAIVGIPDQPMPVLILIGASAVVVGLIIVLAGLLPGRRPRHHLINDRLAMVVDNEVVASALARRAALVAGVDPDNVSVSVSHRHAVVRLTPVSGLPVDEALVNDVIGEELASYGLRPQMRATVLIRSEGKVGA
ncbi:DUF6286 domain-containing protein [Glaciibacter psychrotolerans]|uniref:Uncharacterized protein YjeT (DUF2065 family) n=1 Tax=Glaciibacter psychrotolerans TaxID=670054 RepID=A0A7Z0ED82_9MICO|nr:uncharacterized protein YjeT (DUF2065 family) [Leifsonia psychrotolerans]